MNITTVIVGLSGGVDSAVTALLLKEQGFEVRAVFMLNWSETGEGCNWEWDYESAKLVANHLNIPLELWNFEDIYRREVYEPFIEFFNRGETPNPDVICNRYVKFGAFLDRARKEGADWVATGHYASIRPNVRAYCNTPLQNEGNEYCLSLLSGIDKTKDQSYFLATLTQEQLKYTLFPLGGLTKKEVRKIAHAYRLPNAGRKDSYGICFIGEQPMEGFLRSRVKHAKGPMLTVEGEKIGEHDGLPFYTIGQRKGIGIGGTGPYYVVDKRIAENTLAVTANPDDPALMSGHAIVPDMHWIVGTPHFPLHCLARHRHLQPLQNATVEPINSPFERGAEGGVCFNNGGIKVIFDEPQRAVTPGQFLALYDAEVCLGGGVIARSRRLA